MTANKLRFLIIILILLIADLSYIMATEANAADPPELKRLKNLSAAGATKAAKGKLAALRPKAIEETAYALAVQHGVKWRYDQINNALESRSGHIDTIFNFNAHLLYNGMLMPPIVVEAGPGQRLENSKLNVFTDTTYKIIEDARLLTTAPDWRAYLMQQHNAVIDVHPSLYPKTAQERKIWQAAIEKGWAVGVEQAQYLYEQGVNRLKRDILGIIRYRVLALQGIVNVPLIATAETGTQITEKKHKLQLAKTVVRLVKDVQFNEEDKWYPIAN